MECFILSEFLWSWLSLHSSRNPNEDSLIGDVMNRYPGAVFGGIELQYRLLCGERNWTCVLIILWT